MKFDALGGSGRHLEASGRLLGSIWRHTGGIGRLLCGIWSIVEWFGRVMGTGWNFDGFWDPPWDHPNPENMIRGR